MAGNSRRQGATRKPGSKKGATIGSGGRGRKALEGKGPTPKAEDRTYHPAYQRKQAAQRRAEQADGSRGSGGRTGAVVGRSAAQGRAGAPARGADRPDGPEVVVGRNAVLEALRSRVPVESLRIASHVDSDDRMREILQIATGRGYDVLEVSRQQLDRLSDGVVHQGVVLAVPPYEYGEPDDLLDAAERAGERPLIVALDGVTDPRNLGAVLRSAGAFGAHGVLVPERRSAGVTVSAWKVSAGAAARVPVARATNLVRALTQFKKAGCFVVGLDGGGETSINELAFATDPLVLVVGSEGKGLSRLVRDTCDAVASIPIASTIESLNAAVAAGISLYEVARLRAEEAGGGRA